MKSMLRKGLAFLLSAALCAGLVPLLAFPALAAESHEGWTSVTKLDTLYDASTESFYIVNGGNYYLDADITTDKALLIKSGVTVNLCLHSHKLTSNNLLRTVMVEKGGVFNITDCGAHSGCLLNENPSTAAKSAVTGMGGNITIDGGLFKSNSYGIILKEGSTLNMNAGEVQGVSAGLYLFDSSANIKNGQISAKTGIMIDTSKDTPTEVRVLNGRIEGTVCAVMIKGAGKAEARLNIAGGELLGPAKGNCIKFSGSKVFAELSGGDFRGEFVRPDTKTDYKTLLKATGGRYTVSTVYYFLADGYKAAGTGSSDYPYTVEKASYTVTFVDGGGKTLSTQKVAHGESAAAPAVPEKEGYAFDKWDKDFSKVTSDLTVTALWKCTEKKDLKQITGFKVKAGKKRFTAPWTKPTGSALKKIGGYEIQYSLNVSFPAARTVTKKVAKSKKKLVVKKLTKNKKYYVRIRAYRMDGKTKHVSPWKMKKVKIK